MRVAHAIMLMAALALASPAVARSKAPKAPKPQALEAQVAQLTAEVDRLEGARAVRKLQRAFGYYVDRGLWDEAADLFAEDATFESGMDGVYAGKPRIREYLQRQGGGKPGLSYGQLNEHLQLQPVVHVAADAKSAQGRWRDMAMLGQFGKSAAWGDGIWENSYVNDGGVWKIKAARLYVNFVAPYAEGWARLKPAPADWRSDTAKAFPPDRPPTTQTRPFPDATLAPFHYANPVSGKGAAERALASSDARLAPYARRVQLLKDKDAIENLQAAYGYYFDKSMWSEVADLFAPDGAFEYGQMGVYRSPAHIRRALLLFGKEGPQPGVLNTHMQLQSVITLGPDGTTATARWQGMVQYGRPGENGRWGVGVYENAYVKQGGVWKLARLQFFPSGMTDYDLGWTKSAIPMQGPSAAIPPDAPPSVAYRSFPGVYIPPYSYPHPGTGQPIVVPEPADSLFGERK
jgi:hypothetical protein